MAVDGGRLWVFLWCFWIQLVAAQDVVELGKPLNILPSQFWSGDDGPWSTFRIAIGSIGEPQQVEVLPGSSQSASWFVLPQGCERQYGNLQYNTEDCEKARGNVFNPDLSQSWEWEGTYGMDPYLEKQVGYNGNATFGFDDLTLGWPGDSMPAMKNQTVAGYLTWNFTIGSLALNPRPTNFSTYNVRADSLLYNLRNMTKDAIPSLSWSYTAGSFHSVPPTFGSLVLGGYDKTRFAPNNINFPMGKDISFDFSLALQKITTKGSDESRLTKPIIAAITSLVPDIWLPVEDCEKIKEAFNLSYNEETNTYYVSEDANTQHLQDANELTFQVGPQLDGESVTITIPYFNLYMAVRLADKGNSSTGDMAYRFPIRRATNPLQYILGRAFLQSAYLTADYERMTFNVSQALYPTGKEEIMPIYPVGVLEPPTVTNSSSKSKLSTGAIAGIAAGGGIILIVVAVILWMCRRKRIKYPKATAELEDTDRQNMIRHEVDGGGIKHEIGGGLKHELEGDSDPKIELFAAGEQQKPVEIGNTGIELYELPAHDKKYVEMEGEGHMKEMPERHSGDKKS